jgi:hypothetical protein
MGWMEAAFGDLQTLHPRRCHQSLGKCRAFFLESLFSLEALDSEMDLRPVTFQENPRENEASCWKSLPERVVRFGRKEAESPKPAERTTLLID